MEQSGRNCIPQNSSQRLSNLSQRIAKDDQSCRHGDGSSDAAEQTLVRVGRISPDSCSSVAGHGFTQHRNFWELVCSSNLERLAAPVQAGRWRCAREGQN